MKYILIQEGIKPPSDDDQLILDKYFKTKIHEDNEIVLTEMELSQKREIWSLAKMETMVSNDETLSNKYNELAIDGPFKFGYHWNEVIMNQLFNEYVLEDPRYMEKYLNTVAKEKKSRGNPDRKIDKTDFKSYKKREHKSKIKEDMSEDIVKVRDINSDDYQIVSNSQDVLEYKKFIGTEEAKAFDLFFAKFSEDGDILEIFGMEGTVPYVTNSVHRVYPTEVNETTTSASSGQYTGAAFAAKGEMRLGKKPVYAGGTIVENSLKSFEYFENKLNELNEDKKTSSIINKERIGKENSANFKSDLKNNNITKIVDDAKSKEVDQKFKTSEDIEKEELKNNKEFKPVKHEDSDEYKDAVAMQRGYGMQDIKYDRKPSDKFEERAKEDMGEDLYNHGKKKIEFEKNRPMYNKDSQPTEDNKAYQKRVEESYEVTGKYKDLKETKFISFDLTKIQLKESVINDDFVEINLDGMGNIYNNKFTLKEDVQKDLNSYNYYINLNNNNIIKIIKENNDSSFDLSSFKKLSNYSSFKNLRGL